MGTYLSTPKTEKETEYGAGKNLSYGMAGMQGWRQTMEDAHICMPHFADNEDMSLFAVFDGHGGAEVAKFCSKRMGAELAAQKSFVAGDYDNALKAVFHRMDDLLRDHENAPELTSLRSGRKSQTNSNEPAAEEGDSDDSSIWKQIAHLKRLVIEPPADGIQVHAGCTAIVALKHKNMLYCANAGDSRGVLCRNGKAVALSEDHKPADTRERTRIEAAGGSISDVGGVTRVNGNLNLSRAIGDLKYKNNTALPPEAQVITAHPDVRIFELTQDDRFFLLACDGVWDVLSNQDAVQLVSEMLDSGMAPQDVSSAVVDRCLASDPNETCGVGCDNMTCVLIILQHTPAAS